jgi:hypothetical protein
MLGQRVVLVVAVHKTAADLAQGPQIKDELVAMAVPAAVFGLVVGAAVLLQLARITWRLPVVVVPAALVLHQAFLGHQ